MALVQQEGVSILPDNLGNSSELTILNIMSKNQKNQELQKDVQIKREKIFKIFKDSNKTQNCTSNFLGLFTISI